MFYYLKVRNVSYFFRILILMFEVYVFNFILTLQKILECYEMQIEQFSIILLGIIFLIILYAIVGGFLEHKHFHFIHQTGVGIIIGFLFGFIMYLFHDLSNYEFNQQIFFYGLLPPIIFSGGYNLKKRKFFQNFTYIVLFGLLGTLFSFGVILGLTFLINELGLILNFEFSQDITLTTALIVKFSATICATDSVAALTIIKPSQYPKLFSIIFGEGMVNDAVAIILFKVVGGMFDSGDIDKGTFAMLGIVLGKFILNLVSSLLIGLVTALVCCKVFERARYLTSNPVMEVTVIYLFGIMSYVIAQFAQMSGVITVLVCGVCLAHFNFYNLSVTGQISTGVTFQTISFLSQAFVFIYLGLSTMFYISKQTVSFTFILLELLICVLGRFGAIFGLSFLFRLFLKKWKVSNYELAIISFAGTIRGSVAFALILTIESEEQHKQVEMIKTSVLLMVFITTIIMGAVMPNLVNYLLSLDTSNNDQSILQPKQSLLKEEKDKEKSTQARPFFKMLDQEYLKPFFIYNYRERKQQIKQYKKMLKLNSPEYRGGQFVAMMKAGNNATIIGENTSKSLMTDQYNQ